MRKSIVYMMLLPTMVMGVISMAQAQGDAIGTMAGIVMHLNHYPSEDEKEELAGIIRDKHTTTGENVLAGSLMRMRHQVDAADAARLRALVADSKASGRERTLADILLGISHHPSAADRQRLQTLMK